MDFEDIRALLAIGVTDPAGDAAYAVEHDRPAVAEALVLRRIWNRLDDTRTGEGLLAATAAGRRLLATGADPADVLSVATLAAYEAVFDLLFGFAEGMDSDLSLPSAQVPGVVLMETDAHGVPTGRTLDGLHESLLSADPSGTEGADFLR